jgi:N-acetylglucosamine-6-phosphate deacetylase
MRTLLKNCRAVSPDFDSSGVSPLLRGDIIERLVPRGETPPRADKIVDLEGMTAVPGFIDIHCHGRGGADFCDGTAEAFRIIGEGKLEEGVTSFLATAMTVSEARLMAAAAAAAEYMRRPSGARLLGLHLEGPFLNPARAGAQNPAFLRPPDLGLVDKVSSVCPVKIVSFSPELPGAEDFARGLRKRGIVPSGAHSEADYECFLAARAAGMRHLTHFCNVMTPLHHLKFGMVGGALRFSDIKTEIIADGVHLCDEMIELIFRVKSPGSVMLITDAVRAAAMPDGKYDLGGLEVTAKNGKVTLADGTVAGSAGQFHHCLKRALKASGLPLSAVLKSCGLTQARSLGVAGAGSLAPGSRADITVLDENLTPRFVWVGGELKKGDIS